MKLNLKIVTRENWEEAIALAVSEEQRNFVPTVAVSLAKVYIKPDGDGVTYIPFAIYEESRMIGFIMHAYEEETNDSYWINGFLIDEKHQNKGYGTAALLEMIRWIKENQAQCEVIKLTVNVDNHRAQLLYKKVDFVPTGILYGDEEVYRLNV